MPLQIRRGTDAERLLLAVPLANGELLWTTDTKKLFVGDGTTVARDLTAVINYNDVDAQRAAGALIAAASTTDITFSYNSSLNTLTAAVDVSAFRQNINMAGFTLNGAGEINIDGDIRATGRLIGNYSGSLFGDDSTLLIDGTNSVIVGPINSPSITGPLSGNVTGNLVGNVTGNLVGDVVGAVRNEDSSTLVDGNANILSNLVLTISENEISTLDNFTRFVGNSPSTDHTIEFEQIQGSPCMNVKTLLDASVGAPSKINFIGYKTSFNTPGTPVVGDYIGSIAFSTQDSLEGDQGGAAIIAGGVDPNGTVDSEFVTGKITMLTIGGTDALNTTTNFITFDSLGQLAVNQLNAQATLDVNGFAKLAVLTAAPASPANGMVAIADGSTWDPAGTGKSVMVVYLGGGWRVAATAP